MGITNLMTFTMSTADPMIAAIIVQALFDVPCFRILRVLSSGGAEDRNRIAHVLADRPPVDGREHILVSFEMSSKGLPPQAAELRINLDGSLALSQSERLSREIVRNRRGVIGLLRPTFEELVRKDLYPREFERPRGQFAESCGQERAHR